MKTVVLSIIAIIFEIICIFLAYYHLVWPIIGTVAAVTLVISALALIATVLTL